MTFHHPVARPARRVVGAVSTVLLLAVLLAAGLAVVLSLRGYERYVITGRSMTGSIAKGDLAFERRVPVAALEVGDVITYVPPAGSGVDTFVTHRIASIEDVEGRKTFRTKGDANADVDPWTFELSAAEQARFEFSVPKVGWALIALQDRALRILFIGIPAALIALSGLVDLVRRPRADESTTPPIVASV
jgi:signal peptidase I